MKKLTKDKQEFWDNLRLPTTYNGRLIWFIEEYVRHNHVDPMFLEMLEDIIDKFFKKFGYSGYSHAEDMKQECFEKIFKYIHKFDRNRSDGNAFEFITQLINAAVGRFLTVEKRTILWH